MPGGRDWIGKKQNTFGKGARERIFIKEGEICWNDDNIQSE